ncbi:MAG: flagellar biosynthesis anti-sigma factor FlgM [Bryobacteraceae bacterium]|jgi:anti-sigma28 factor (negative regulator of flagellin synthesis)
MKINQSPLDSSRVSQLGKAPGIGSGGAGNRAQTQADRDRVQLSGLSALLLASGEAGAADRTARLQQLSSDVRAGRYQVDPQALSSRLVDEAIRQ